MATPTGDESIQFQIFMDAAQAIASLGDLKGTASSMDEIFDHLGAAMAEFAKSTGAKLSTVSSLFKRVYTEAEAVQAQLASLGESAAAIALQNPLINALSQIQNPFSAAGNPRGELMGAGLTEEQLAQLSAAEQDALEKAQAIGLTLNEGMASATQAAREFSGVLGQGEKNADRIAAALGITVEAAQKIAPALQSIQALDFSKGNYQASFQTLKQNISSIATESKSTFDKVGGYIQQTFNVPKVAVTDAVKQLNNELKGTERGFKAAGDSAKGFNQILHLIRGTLVAIGVFQVFQFLTDSIRKATETAKEFETSLYRIQNVERILSQSGVQTTVQGLLDIVKQLKKELPIFSEADLTQQVSLIGIMTKEFGLTEKQIHDVAAAIGVLNIRSGETEDLLTTTNKVLTAMVAPSGRGIASLGLDFSEAAIQALALKTNVLKAGEEFTKLTDHQKDMLKIGILLQSTGEEFKTVEDFIKTNTGALAEQEAQWEDTLRTAGQAFLTLKASAAPFVTSLLKGLEGAINGFKALMIVVEAIKNVFLILGATIQAAITNPLQFLTNPDLFKSVGDAMSKAFSDTMKEGFARLFSNIIPSDAPEWFKNLFEGMANQADTATGSVNKLANAMDNLGTALQNAKVDDLLKDLERLQQRMEEMERDFNLKMQRMDEDFATSQARAYEDYQRDVANTLQDYNDKRQDAEARYRLQEAEAEARFQENLRQLRQKFLFDLEDGLRARDARQILRTIKQYQMEKENLTNEEKLRKEFAARQHAEEMARLEREKNERLQQLAEEYELKKQRAIEDYNERKAREMEDHANDMADLQKQIDDRLQQFAKALADELGLREGGADAIYQKLKEYYGQGGLLDGLYDYSIGSMTAKAQMLLDILTNLMNQYQSTLNEGMNNLGSSPRLTPSYAPGDPWWNDVGNQAGGGTYIADQPTRAVFGEHGKEMAQFIPLRGGTTNLPTNLTGTPTTGGNLMVRIMLSDGLESEIVNKSLEGVTAVLEQVERNRK